MKRFTLIFSLYFLPIVVFAQTIRGVVIDQSSNEPIIGANVVMLKKGEQIKVVDTDLEGRFVIEDAPLGRYELEIIYLGYENYLETGNLLSARESLHQIKIIPHSGYDLEEISVVAGRPGGAVNPLIKVGGYSFSAEETVLGTATAGDMGRFTMALPGVQPTRDTRSDLIIRGNSPVGLIWRLEGIDIPNPNHFARRGSSGGGITIFSLSMVDRTDFSTGAFPAQYGNGFSGVFDVGFRNGNNVAREYTFKAGILGLEFATEGPIQDSLSSYSMNYRYSTLGVLNSFGIYLVGERIDNTFQDLSFKLHFPSKKNNGNTFSIWGIGGLSTETQRPSDTLRTFSDFTAYEFTTNMGALGLTQTTSINGGSYIKTSLAIMAQQVVVQDDTVTAQLIPTRINRENFINSRVSFSSIYNNQLSDNIGLQAGLFASNLMYNLQHDSLSFVDFVDRRILDEQGSSFLIQPFGQLSFDLGPFWKWDVGIHALYLTLNNTYSIEPRTGLQFRPNDRHTIALGYGLHGRILPIGTYFTQVRDAEGNITQPNLDLEIPQAHHLVLSYQRHFANSYRFLVEAYFQYMTRIPVSPDPNSTYWIFNDIQGYSKEEVVSEGLGRNMGIDIAFQKFLGSTDFFFTLSGSVFRSEYQSVEQDEWYSTQYDSGLSAAFFGGKEFRTDKGNIYQLGLKFLYNSGLPLTPLLDNVPVSNPKFPPLDQENPYSTDIQDYFRPDLRIAYTNNGKNTAWTLALDIQNFINRRNIDGLNRVYDPDLNSWVFRLQSGLTPLISFQIDL